MSATARTIRTLASQFEDEVDLARRPLCDDERVHVETAYRILGWMLLNDDAERGTVEPERPFSIAAE
jgi:hypothetical protein